MCANTHNLNAFPNMESQVLSNARSDVSCSVFRGSGSVVPMILPASVRPRQRPPATRLAFVCARTWQWQLERYGLYIALDVCYGTRRKRSVQRQRQGCHSDGAVVSCWTPAERTLHRRPGLCSPGSCSLGRRWTSVRLSCVAPSSVLTPFERFFVLRLRVDSQVLGNFLFFVFFFLSTKQAFFPHVCSSAIYNCPNQRIPVLTLKPVLLFSCDPYNWSICTSVPSLHNCKSDWEKTTGGTLSLSPSVCNEVWILAFVCGFCPCGRTCRIKVNSF